MNKTISYVLLFLIAAVLLVAAFSQPYILSNQNEFLANFVNHEFLNVLGVILAITLASAGQLHLKFNEIEERYDQKGGLSKTRRGVHQAAYWLIALFLLAVVVVVAKPVVTSNPLSEAICNALAIFILVWYVLLLISLTQTTFKITADIDD